MIKHRNITMYLTVFYLGIIVSLIAGADGQNHAFIQVDKELEYLVDGVTVNMADVLKSTVRGGGEVLPDDEGSSSVMMLDDKAAASHRAPLAHKNYITFDPPHLDFKRHPVGMPVMRKVVVRNIGPYSGSQTAADSAAVQLHSLSGNTLHFHCTFFQDKVVGVFSNTTFDVVFLGREEGLIQNTIFIHTSIGTYKYEVRAVGTSNPYRLRPFVGVRMPLNSSYTPLITLHNPHSYPLQVREMYSSGGDLHLELLKGSGGGGEDEASSWRVPAYHTQHLARATFVARRENNHTAYIRIVTSGVKSDYLVVPVEVEVSNEPGLYCPSDGLHFPLITPHHSITSLPLMLLNSAHKHIHIQNVITTPVNDAITVEFKPIKIPPGTVKPTQVATVTFDPSKVHRRGSILGKLLVKSKVAAYKLSIPYSVNMYHGHLRYQRALTSFYTGPVHLDPLSNPSASSNSESTRNSSHYSSHSWSSFSSPLSSSLSWSSSLSSSSSVSLHTSDGGSGSIRSSSGGSDEMLLRAGEPRNLTLSNTFSCAVVVYNVTLPQRHQHHFKVRWSGPVLLAEGGEEVVASLQLLSVASHLRLSTELTVHTNITIMIIPVIAYNGRLTKFSSGPVEWDSAGQQQFDREEQNGESGSGEAPTIPDTVDLGTVGMAEQRHLQFYVLNENPVPLQLLHWATNVSWCNIDLVQDGKTKNAADSGDSTVWIEPGSVLLLRLRAVTPSTEGVFWAAASVQTLHETLTITFRLRTAVGQLTMMPSPVLFHDSFPGKVSSVSLRVLSTFSHSMQVQDVLPQMFTHQFWFRRASEGENYTLAPETLTPIGTLYYDPKLHCHKHCYAGFILTDKLGQQWGNSLALSGHVGSTDAGLLSSLRQRYNNITTRFFNTTLLLHTSHLHAFPFTVQVSLVWPRIVSPRELVFPLTEPYNSSVATVSLSNPTDSVLYTQVLFLHQYPSPHVLYDVLTSLTGQSDWAEQWEGDGGGSDAFRLLDLDTSGAGGTSSTTASSCSVARGATTSIFGAVVGVASIGAAPHAGSCKWGHVDIDPAIASGVAQHKKQIETELTNRVSKETMVFRLGPGDQVDVRVLFRPVAVGRQYSVLLVRNNLTVVDAVLLRAASGQGTLKFANRKPDASPLTFSIAAKHLNDCHAAAGGRLSREPKLTVKRTFTARNTGQLPVTVAEFLVAGVPCQSYGFKVIQCESFTLAPNASRKIDIAFTPDFTMSKVQQSLTIITDIGMTGEELVYTLQATIPVSLLAVCSSALPRPSWEMLLYYTLLFVLVVMLVATLFIAKMDADVLNKINYNNMVAQHQPEGIDKEKVFDLRSICLKDTRKLFNTNVSLSNGQIYQDQSHQRNVLTKVGSNYTNSNNKKNLSNYINPAMNDCDILSGKYKSCKHNDYRSESVSGLNNSSGEVKAKEHWLKSHNNTNDNSRINSNIVEMVNFVGELRSSVWLYLCRTFRTPTPSSPLVEHNRRKKHNSGNNAGSKSNKDVCSRKAFSTSRHNNNNNINYEFPGSSKSEIRDTANDKFSKYSKEFRSDSEYKCKDKNARRNCNERRPSKECSYSKGEFVDEDSSSTSSKTSQKQREYEEETSSCTTESSNTEDLPASDKDSSKSESSSSHGGSSSSNYKKKSLNIKCNNNSQKKSTKIRSQASLPSSSSSSSASPSPTTTTTGENSPLSNPAVPRQSFTANEHDESGFEIALKGKGIKSIKSYANLAISISADHGLELPYSPKTMKPPTSASDSLLKRTKRRTVRIKSESSLPSSVSNHSLASTKNTPTDINTTPNSSTQNSFVPGHASRSSSQIQPILSRDSYSAKVLGHEKQKAKVTPIVKILPEVNRVLPQRSLGAIGQKITSSVTPYNHQPLAMFAQELPQHSPLQQFYANATNTLSAHSWDIKTVTPPHLSTVLPPPGLSSPEDWFFKQVKNNSLNSNSMNNSVEVWSSQMYQPPEPRPTPLPSSPAPWSSGDSIWSSNNWNSAGNTLPSLWPASTHTAVSQGLGFDPVGGGSGGGGGGGGGWPMAAQQILNPSAVSAAAAAAAAGSWPPEQQATQQPSSLTKQNTSE